MHIIHEQREKRRNKSELPASRAWCSKEWDMKGDTVDWV